MLNNHAVHESEKLDPGVVMSQSDSKPSKAKSENANMSSSKSKSSTSKHSYTIPCSSAFRDRVSEMAERKKVNVADLARSVLLMVSCEEIEKFADPGEPLSDDRETVILKSGPSKGRPWRRKPRLQVRMAPGFDVHIIRKALNLALYMEQGSAQVRIDTEETLKAQEAEAARLRHEAEELAKKESENNKLPETIEELERLQAIVSVLSFEPLRHGVQDRSDALHILGFAPKSYPDRSELRARFRMLATIHHPDGKYGSHERMSQLNQAMEILR